jgi:type VI secretion system secreted protein VgrG
MLGAMSSPFVFHSDAVADEATILRSIRGHERVSGLFEIVLEVQPTGDKALIEDALDDLLAQPASFGRSGTTPLVWGLLRDVELVAATPADAPTYRFTLVPRLWRATQTARCRIFQDMTVPDIVAAVLQALELATGDFTMQLRETYAKRDYVVQYEESDFDFISRLCEREGIFYWFDHTGGSDRIVFADANGAARELPEHQGVGFAQGRGDHAHALSRLGRRTRRVQERVELLDYNWRAPSLALASTASVAGGTTGTWTDTDEHYRDKTTGDRLARVRAEEIAARRVVFEGASDIETLRPGDLLDVHGHLVATLDRKLFIEEVRYGVTQGATRAGGEPESAAFHNELVAIDSLTPYRPELSTRVPRIAGFVYATVDGPDLGAAAPIDAQGRYKVIYPFDTSQRGTGKATRWVRMAQGLSGVGFGIHFPLRVGAEVVLVHVNGDPDRPIIAGTTPNAVTASPVTQKNATQSVMQTNAGIRVELEDHATGT